MSIFVDTSFYQALRNVRDENYANAQRIAGAIGAVDLVTSEWVLSEFLGAMSRGKQARKAAMELVRDAYRDRSIEIVPATSEDFVRGLELYEKRLDKDWSVVDCISFLLMWDRKIERVLTFDEHFGQAGFDVLG